MKRRVPVAVTYWATIRWGFLVDTVKTVRGTLAAAMLLGGLARSSAQVDAAGGVPLWTNRYHGPGNGDCVATALAVDPSGDVLVTGYTPGSGGHDFATIKYSGAGTPLWTNRYGGTANDYGTGVAAGPGGNVFVTGQSQCSINGTLTYCYATVAYSGAGVPLWTNLYGATGNSFALAIAVDSSGNAFVTGMSDDDYATIAYSGQGVPLWTNRYNGLGNGEDYPEAIAVDKQGNVFIAGHSLGAYPPGVDEYATVAYSGTGQPLWTNRYGDSQNHAVVSRPAAIVADKNGNVFVTGYSGYPAFGNYNYDYVTVAYSASGQPLWTNRYDGPAFADDRANGIAVDSDGNVFVTGNSMGASGYECATLAYSAAGVLLWCNRSDGPRGSDQQSGIAVDRGGNVFVTDAAPNTSGYMGYFTVAYSNAGLPLWTNCYHGLKSPYYSYPSLIALDGSGNVFVTGRSRSEVNGLYFDYATVKYSSSWVPYLALELINNQMILSWTNAAFILQTSPALQGFTDLPGATSPYTNSITGIQQYFRLKAK
jgi:hypothetical protein